MISLLVVSLVISSFSYDDLAHWDSFAATLPVSRRKLVASNICFCFCWACWRWCLTDWCPCCSPRCARGSLAEQFVTGILISMAACIIDFVLIR
ncbi:MAG: ABC-2 transporter permease [Merdibacter sp.]